MVRQEIYGYLLTHYAISALICRAATEADVDPDRVKFLRTVRRVCRRAADPAFPLTRPGDRSPRSWPTSPARATSTQPGGTTPTPASSAGPGTTPDRVKRPGDTGNRYHGPPTIRLVNLPATVMINLG